MNRVTIINGLKGEGKSEEIVGDFLGHVKDDELMKHYFLTTLDHGTAVGLMEHMLEGMRKSNPNFAKNANMGVYTIETWADLKRMCKDVDDDSSILYVDGTEKLDYFDMGDFLELVDAHQFDCYITRQRCKYDRVTKVSDLKVGDEFTTRTTDSVLFNDYNDNDYLVYKNGSDEFYKLEKDGRAIFELEPSGDGVYRITKILPLTDDNSSKGQYKNCLITIGPNDLLPECGREVISSRTDSKHYDLFTGNECKITDLESSVVMDRTITTVKVGGKYIIDIYDVDASIYRDGKVIGKSSFVYMPVERRDEHLVMEQFCGELEDCSLLNYWLMEDNIADIASILSKAKC